MFSFMPCMIPENVHYLGSHARGYRPVVTIAASEFHSLTLKKYGLYLESSSFKVILKFQS